jgi:hypothetical protein
MGNDPCQKCQLFLDEFAIFLECNEITLKALPPPKTKHHNTLDSLKAAAAEGCGLCILFLGLIDAELETARNQFQTSYLEDPDGINAQLTTHTQAFRPQNWRIELEMPSKIYVGDEKFLGPQTSLELHPVDPATLSSKFITPFPVELCWIIIDQRSRYMSDQPKQILTPRRDRQPSLA